MTYVSFENLEVWKRSCRLAVEIYGLLRDCKEYVLRDQMTRAAISIASNIAEGAERGSKAEFIRFLNIARDLRLNYAPRFTSPQKLVR